MTLSDFEWLSEIFNDMKRRAVSPLQMSYLYRDVANKVRPEIA